MASKTKVISKAIGDKGVTDMFNQMLGGEGDPEIMKVKNEKLHGFLNNISKTIYKKS